MASEAPFEMKMGINGVDWTKLIYNPATSAYGQATKGLLEVGASCLHDHADYLHKLAECTTPAEIVACQMDLMRSISSRYLSAATHVFDGVKAPQILTPAD
ncbi:hypothetical protein XH98_13805 [Bradyrhizobium sp. CCBAU 51745]|uniref:phasin family protein n=1 Tax=Bradyrhizobium sp. CCBAU 51745 TaxID=1325099 RepID=UPI002305B419|nr:phasin family protein [Bradyrhizobium sp. CCBAU 51745]MDA9440182.1 hypothetical protein [Bradyrhizobium sp. CCBAU 51745]